MKPSTRRLVVLAVPLLVVAVIVTFVVWRDSDDRTLTLPTTDTSSSAQTSRPSPRTTTSPPPQTTTVSVPGWIPEYREWEGGYGYYDANGFANSFGAFGPDFFPIAWFGDHGANPDNLRGHRELGFNLIVAVDSSVDDLANIRAAGLYAIVAQRPELLELPARQLDVVKGWYILDEPDNASGGDQQCTDPQQLAVMTERVRRLDPTRPRMVIFGDGLAVGPPVTENAWYIGRGACFARDDDYERYIRATEFQQDLPGAGLDIVSFDHYVLGQTGGGPVARTPDGASEDHKVVGPDALQSVPDGRVRAYELVPTLRTQPFWQVVEAVPFSGDYGQVPTEAQMRYLVWSSIIHGATGIVWWDLQTKPNYRGTLLLDDPERAAAVAKINAEVQEHAHVLNASAPVTNGASVQVDAGRVDLLVKASGNERYVFAAAMENQPSQATFTLKAITSATVEVVGENRTLPVSGGQFTDHFEGYGVHIYRVSQ